MKRSDSSPNSLPMAGARSRGTFPAASPTRRRERRAGIVPGRGRRVYAGAVPFRRRVMRRGLALALAQGFFAMVLPAAAQGTLQRQLNEPFPLVPAEDVVELGYGPGGTRIAYWVRGGDGASTLYCRAADGSDQPLALATNTGESFDPPRFLSDGVRILFAVHDASRVRVFTVPFDGSAAPFEPIGHAIRQFQLTSDEAHLVYSDDPFTAGRFVLLSRPLAGGSPTILNGPLVAGGDVHEFSLSADGSRAVYWADEVAVPGIYSAPVGVAGGSVNIDGGNIAFHG